MEIHGEGMGSFKKGMYRMDGEGRSGQEGWLKLQGLGW